VYRARSLSPEENQRVCEAVRALATKYRTQGEMAASIYFPDGRTVSAQTVSDAMRGQPVGSAFASALARRLGISYDQLVTGRSDSTRRYQDLPGWAAAAEQAILAGLAPRYAVEEAGRSIISFPVEGDRATAALAGDQARLWLAYAPLDVRRALESAAADREVERARDEDARRRKVERSSDLPVLAAVPPAVAPTAPKPHPGKVVRDVSDVVAGRRK
jgi:hypothetical protein